MHQCEEFRERITERIIDRQDLVGNAELQQELLLCSACAEFYLESQEMIEALSTVDLSISEGQWYGIERRLRMGIVNSAGPPLIQKSTRSLTFAPVLAAAAMLLLTSGLYWVATPLINSESPATTANPALYVGPSVSLDPVTVDFLEESELLLRNVMKITPNDMDDLADAQKVANGQLADIEKRKEAAADVPPVVGVMDTYETILRDIRNVDERNATEDIADIQSRIQKNGLIANIKSFQPGVTPVSLGAR